ncbi:MAG: hypothetical protein JRM85_01765 [Nitrososphaerota archaeon]|nr:hypothetical protein [Nitrososphaerota archaeon]MDG6916307.1 hypothetical protein [Nitrososphaerota archaeon]MDG6946162.1 hypothetical protein [Nitrososphaerota archaeon]
MRHDGNDPGYSYAGDNNTRPFNGSLTFQERAYFDNFTFTSLSYQPSNVTGAFMYHVVNSTGSLRYRWLNGNSSALLEGNRRIEKYVFDVGPLRPPPGHAHQRRRGVELVEVLRLPSERDVLGLDVLVERQDQLSVGLTQAGVRAEPRERVLHFVLVVVYVVALHAVGAHSST